MSLVSFVLLHCNRTLCKCVPISELYQNLWDDIGSVLPQNFTDTQRKSETYGMQ